jgi:hypothetical protein
MHIIRRNDLYGLMLYGIARARRYAFAGGGGIFTSNFATHTMLKTAVWPCDRTRAANSGS